MVSLAGACTKPLVSFLPTASAVAEPHPPVADAILDVAEPATEIAGNFLEVGVDSVRVNITTQRRVLLLQELATRRYLPIWTGPQGADAIAIGMQHLATGMPLSHELMLDLVAATG